MSEVARVASNSADTEIPAFEIFDADGNKIFDTNEDSPQGLQEANARLAVAAPELLLSLIECARLLADYDESEGEEGTIYRRANAIIEQAISKPSAVVTAPRNSSNAAKDSASQAFPFIRTATLGRSEPSNAATRNGSPKRRSATTARRCIEPTRAGHK
jgi:hypothetical protein